MRFKQLLSIVIKSIIKIVYFLIINLMRIIQRDEPTIIIIYMDM